jgi:methyl-accepting chemotaxis protein
MGSEVFQWVIAIAVLVVFIVNMVVLTLIYMMLKPLIAGLKKASDHVNPILSDMQRIISDNRDKITATVSESQPVVKDIMIKTNDIAGVVHGILGQAHGIVNDNRETINNTISESKPLVRDILIKTNHITATVHDILNDAQPVVRDIGTKANDITGATRDIALTLKNQAERLDELVRRTTDKIDSTTTTVQKQVTEPVREINHIGVAIKRAISTLFNNRSGKTVS